ncbi:MAG: type I DNA topoisomerase [Patescibacteria group bacterium]
MLIIVESPAKAKTISKIVGKNYTVKASIGHIRGISHDKKTKDGRSLEINGIDIENNFTPIYEIDSDKKAVVTDLKKLAKSAKDGILFATDADREGEAISWHLAEVLGIKDKTKIRRLEFHEITKKAIQDAISNPRSLNLQLVSAQRARQVLDKLVGYKLSPVLWNTMSNFKLSAGRVQSPALHLICEREKEILKFKPEEYWEIFGDFDLQKNSESKLNWNLASDTEDNKQINKKDGLLKLHKLKGKSLPSKIESKEALLKHTDNLHRFPEYNVSEVDEKLEKSSARAPFITSTLQQAASSKLGIPPKLAMQLAQKLYEGIELDGHPTALITYMRTDSTNLSKEAIFSARKFIESNYPQYLPKSPKTYKSKSRNAQEAHEAIRPVNISLHPDSLKSKLDARMWKVYDLIWRQTVASQMTDEIRKRLSFVLQNNRKDEFTGSVAWTVEPGFKTVTGEKYDTTEKSYYKQGQVLFLQEVFYYQKFTKPPSRFSPASLIKKLEDLGVGRPSTYASIISTLQDREYVETKQSAMHPTSLGMKINDLLTDNFNIVTSPELTANMESQLDEVSRGEKDYKAILDDFWWDFKKDVETKSGVITQDKNKYKSSSTDVKCPTCGSAMELKIGRFGEYFQCLTHKEHMFAKNFREYEAALQEAREKFTAQTKGKVCDLCGKDLIVRVSKSSLKPYIACPEYKVGNKHTVMPVNYGPCPKCAQEGRTGKKQGVLIAKKAFRGKSFIGCSLDKDVCGYVQK